MQNIKRKNRMIETYSLLCLDMVALVVSYTAALLLYNLTRVEIYDGTTHRMGYWYLLLFCVLYSVFIEGNRDFFTRGYYVEFVAIVKYTLTLMIGLVMVMFFTKEVALLSRLIFGFFAVFNIIFTYIFHVLFKKYMLVYYRKSKNSSKVMVVTTDDRVEKIVEDLQGAAAWNSEIIAVALMDAKKIGEDINGVPIVADEGNLYEISTQMLLDEIFISLPEYGHGQIKEMIAAFESMGVVCHYAVDFIEVEDGSERMIENFGGYAVISYSLNYFDVRRLIIKRIMDIMGGLIGLLLTALITPFVALAIKAESPGPVFFSQVRIGKNGRRFKIYKFRSMYVDAEERKKELEAQNELSGPMFKMENDPRITKVGKFLRKTSIDETPQFYNILVGQMSLVGTRPPTEDEFEQYSMYYKRRLSIRPGLTGMWQVNGRSEVTDFDDVVKYDLEYIDNWSLGLDIKLIMKTFTSVLFHKGAK